MRTRALVAIVTIAVFGSTALTPQIATAAKGLPATNVATHSGYIVVSTTAKTSGLDTSVYISTQTPGSNFIIHTGIPATIANDPAWNCPCTAQIAYRGKNGTSKVLTAPSAPFTPTP